MTSVQVMQHLELVTRSLNTAMAVNSDMIKTVAKLVSRVEDLTKEVEGLKRI
jgi:archaellum component FlaC